MGMAANQGNSGEILPPAAALVVRNPLKTFGSFLLMRDREVIWRTSNELHYNRSIYHHQ